MGDMKFSVAMSVYKGDNPVFFDRALESITDLQIVKPSEIVLVVDGPVCHDLNRVIEKYIKRYDFFNVLYLQKNNGLGNALKIAVENARFELIARMDSDDIALPTRFEQQITFFQNNADLDILGGDISEFIDDEANVVAYRQVPKSDFAIKLFLKQRCPFNHVTVMFKKKAVQEAGGYLDLFWNEDYYLWIRMSEKNFMMANTGTVLVNVRTGKDMYNRRGGKRYYQSEKFLQDYMLKRNMISFVTYLLNLTKRFIVQVLLPASIRGWVFRAFARR